MTLTGSTNIYTSLTQSPEALHSSVSREERLDAIFKCISTFEHDDVEQHNLEMKAGADIALVKMLAFLEFKTGFRRLPIKANIEAITQEISLTCQALEMVYHASSDSVEISFNRVGPDLMQIIVILMDEEVKVRTQRFNQENSPASAASVPQNSRDVDGDFQLEENTRKGSVTPPPQGGSMSGEWDRDLMLCKAVKILGHYARVGGATRDIAHFPGLLGTTLNLINLRPYNSVPWEARLSCLWVIANLACSMENMMMMTCTPGLINSLVNVGFRQVEPMEPLERTMEVLRARSLVARALSNLTWSPENKVILADNAALVTMLSQLTVKRKSPYSRSKTMQDVLTQTRQYAVGALRNLAAAPRRSKITLCEYGNGELLDTLADAALHDDNEYVVAKALAAVHNLAIHDNAEVMASKRDLVVALKNQLVSNASEGEAPSKAKAHASATLLVLERSIAPETPLYENLRELLYVVNAHKPTEEESSESGSEYPEGSVPV